MAEGRIQAICSSSDGHFAGIRSAAHLRAILAHIRMEVIARQCSVPYGDEAFDEDGNFRQQRMRASMSRLAADLVQHARLLSARTEA